MASEMDITDSESESSDSDNPKKVQTRAGPSDANVSGLQTLSILQTYVENKVVFYCINVKMNNEGWVATKRYSEFRTLKKDLKKRHNANLPYLPGKRMSWKVDHFEDAFIEKRRALLDNYCKKLLENRQLRESAEVISFFSGSKDTGRDFEYEVIPCFPKTQEVTDISVPKWRKMTDHILYTLDVTNKHTQSNWIMLKRYTQFHRMDRKVRKDLPDQIKEKLPRRPGRKAKMWKDHMKPDFIEKRRVMLESYLRHILTISEYAHNHNFLDFIGVGTETQV